ncbi:hypothetical protein B0J11DRAFT_581768 [Dendryphion nanum]|uniref:F-box domain-containing protein n=1 Tax=Dendryphion nanum TaxID=256645 RepID=A0A9P9II45_9PLEO|nr:hypothetical protein B0J11DRAFT_581768 [Dendryphion nanum]
MPKAKRHAKIEKFVTIRSRRIKTTNKDMKARDVTNENHIVDLRNSPEEPFRFLDLPSELRLTVYRYLVPHQMGIALLRPEESPLLYDVRTNRVEQGGVRIQCSIFLVSKIVCNEARGVLYGENTFNFTIDAQARQPKSLRSPEIFGPFGTPERLPLLRELRSVHFNVKLTELGHWAVERHRGRLGYFISVLKEHSDDTNQKSLLQRMVVKFTVCVDEYGERYYHRDEPGTSIWPRPLFNARSSHEMTFGLESLASFHGVKDVKIEGDVPDWFASCLELSIQDKGGDVLELEYPEVMTKKVARSSERTKRTKWVMKSTKRWYDPKYNWKAFADRNGIEMPNDLRWV